MKRLLLVSAISIFSTSMHAMNWQNQSTPPKKISAFAEVKPQPLQQRSAFTKVKLQHPMLKMTLDNSKQIKERSNGNIIVTNTDARHQHEAKRRQNEYKKYENDAILALKRLSIQARAQAFTIPAKTPIIKVTPNKKSNKTIRSIDTIKMTPAPIRTKKHNKIK